MKKSCPYLTNGHIIVSMTSHDSHFCGAYYIIVPYLQPELMKQSSIAAMALFICGSIASDKYSLLSSG